MLAAIAVGTAVMVFNFREKALNASARELENTVLMLTRHFDQQLEEMSVVQNDIIAQMQSAGVTSSNDMHDMLSAKMNAMSYVGVLNVYDADGQLVASSNSYPVPAINISEQRYFIALRSDPNRTTVLSEPYQSRFSGALTAPIYSAQRRPPRTSRNCFCPHPWQSKSRRRDVRDIKRSVAIS